jgi:hypothetical protein
LVKVRVIVDGVVQGFGYRALVKQVDKATLEDNEFGKLYFIGFRDEMKGFREDTNKNFKEMAEKYGDISEELKEFRKTVKEFLGAFLSEYQKRATKQ